MFLNFQLKLFLCFSIIILYGCGDQFGFSRAYRHYQDAKRIDYKEIDGYRIAIDLVANEGELKFLRLFPYNSGEAKITINKEEATRRAGAEVMDTICPFGYQVMEHGPISDIKKLPYLYLRVTDFYMRFTQGYEFVFDCSTPVTNKQTPLKQIYEKWDRAECELEELKGYDIKICKLAKDDTGKYQFRLRMLRTNNNLSLKQRQAILDKLAEAMMKKNCENSYVINMSSRPSLDIVFNPPKYEVIEERGIFEYEHFCRNTHHGQFIIK